MVNQYTDAWFQAFAASIEPSLTSQEVAGFTKWLPLPDYRRILDVCCGLGHHDKALVGLRYEVTGVDRDAGAIAVAARAAPEARFMVADQRNLKQVAGLYNAVLSLWQSFGYFDSETNDAVLAEMASKLRPGGRLLLDIYHPAYWRDHQGVRERPREGVRSITDTVEHERLTSHIVYVDETVEVMDFELIEPHDLTERAAKQGLQLMNQCTWWDPQRAPDSQEARYQTIFERT